MDGVFLKRILLLGIVLLQLSCNSITSPEEGTTTTNLSGISTDQAKVLSDNPVIMANNLSVSTDMNKVQSRVGTFITDKPFLDKDCDFSYSSKFTASSSKTASNCLSVANDDVSLPGQRLQRNSSGNWGFDANTDSFLQVNGFYHANFAIDRFLKFLEFSYKYSVDYVDFPYSAAVKDHFPTMPFDPTTFWFNIAGTYKNLTLYTRCSTLEQNAVFRPAPLSNATGPSICMGIDSNIPGFAFSQDPTVIYHELGHAFVKIMMNVRNEFSTSNIKSDLGSLFYDEAGAINEGIADYFSYVMTDRPFIGEWAMQKYYNAGRSMTENINENYPGHPVGNVHGGGLAKTDAGRLYYPHYVNYNANNKDLQVEDIHYSGQVISHFLVATTEMIRSRCQMDHAQAEDRVLYFISEALGEIGDLSSELSDPIFFSTSPFFLDNNFKNNLVPFYSVEQSEINNPGNFRRFIKIFSKHFYHKIVENECLFKITQQDLERLLDSYGLLLFKTYDNDLDLVALENSPYFSNTTNVDSNNRLRTVLVSKDFIRLPQTDTDPKGRQPAFVFDDQFSIPELVNDLTFKGAQVQVTSGLADTSFNNSNGKISPGEVVGLVLNLVNDSNSQIGGVQVLANDWDHMRKEGTYYKPCQINNFPLSSEGAASTTNSTLSGGCEHYVGQGYMNTLGGSEIDIDLNNNGVIDAANVTINSVAYSEIDIVDNQKNYQTPFAAGDPVADGLIDELKPICMVQKRQSNETVWVSQNEYRKTQMALTDNECLGKDNTLTFDGDSCLLRVLPGANQAYFSLLNPQKTWAETIQEGGDSSPTFNSSAAVLMEVNKWVSPGTTFMCRFRVRFSNCDNCYHDTNNSNDDYPEYLYTGEKPFKVIDFKFTVID